MRRAILTLFRSTNFGCVSQAMASVAALRGTVVDFVDEERREFYRRRVVNAVTKATFSTLFPLSRPVDDPLAIEHLLNEEFDEVFLGSDEILKFRTAGEKAYFLTPFPTPFWLSRRVTIRKVLWAASIGSVDYQRVDRETMLEAMSRLSDFAHLGVRDMRTYEFIRQGSTELARRVEIVPDPTWLFWPRILFETPMRFMQTNGIANSYHNLIAHLMRGQRVQRVTDFRPKTLELARDFDIQNWDEARVVQKCLACRNAAWNFADKVMGTSSVNPEEKKHSISAGDSDA